MASGQVTNAFSFLVETVLNLYLVALMLRVLLEAIRADWRNPLVQILIRVTEPILGPLRRVLPNLGRISLAGIVALYLLQLLILVLVHLIGGLQPDWAILLVMGVVRLLRTLLILYMVLIIIGVVISWLGTQSRHPIIPLIHQLNAPVLDPIRRLMPNLGGLDLSPLVAIIGIQFLLILLAF